MSSDGYGGDELRHLVPVFRCHDDAAAGGRARVCVHAGSQIPAADHVQIRARVST